jgi:hypothetical protein
MSILKRAAVVLALIGAVLVVVAGAAGATEPDPPQTYRIGLWLCAANHSDPLLNPCVLDTDPDADPVSVEPDNDPVTAGEVLDAITPDPDAAREDEPGFDCRTGGNGICGPGSGFTPGCYNRNTGAFIAPWQEDWRAVWRPRQCGRPTAHDRAQQARLNGEVGQLCAATEAGTGTVCWYVDQPRPKIADGPARFVGSA